MTPRELTKLQAQENRDLIKVSNSLVDSFITQNNAIALKTLFYIAKMRPAKQDTDLNTYNFKISDLVGYSNLTVRQVRDTLKKLREASISYVKYDDNKKPFGEVGITLLPYTDWDYYSNNIEIKIFRKIADLVLEVEKAYSIIDVKNLMEVSSKHALRMLIILEHIYGFMQNGNTNIKLQKTYSLEDLNDMFDTKYKNCTEFDRRVLSSAKAELDDKSEISFNYSPHFGYTSEDIKKGRPKALGFTITLIVNKIRQRRLF